MTEVFHAHFVDYAYPPHTHDAWTVIVLDEGSIRYDLEHRRRSGSTRTVSVLPPHTVHDGRAATAAGFTKRVLYLDETVLSAELTGPAVDCSEISDVALKQELVALHDAIRGRDEALDGEERLDRVARGLRRHLAAAPNGPRSSFSTSKGDAERLREFLDSNATRAVTLNEASSALGRSIGYLSRSFRVAYGLSPHAYVIGRRVDHARRLLLDGWTTAAAATASGFFDQAHLHRHFAKFTGTTPGLFGSRSY
ncbi:MAG TPA: AraC family transcriptional regulator [Mycobacteriales bacterium]|nr:AraC family transcriptional regulator [Mycobacteriales bacterium]